MMFITKYSKVVVHDDYVKKEYLQPDLDEELISNEVDILKRGWSITPTLLHNNPEYIILERCYYGSLRYIISSHNEILTDDLKYNIVSQCEDVLKFFDSINFVHGDFTSFNILITGKLQIKICDFMTSGKGFINNCAIRWRETCEQQLNNRKHDLFAFGIVIWELINNQGPYFWINNDDEVRQILNNGVRLYSRDHPLKLKYINLMKRRNQQ